MIHKSILLKLVFTFLPVLVLARQPASDPKEYIMSFTKLWNIPGLSAAVSVNGNIVFRHNEGFASLETKTPVSDKTVFRIYSSTKVMTGIAVVKLAELGLLKLDDDVRKYVPYFPDKNKTITIRQLLMHTSGIRHYDDGESSFKTEHYNSAEEAIALFANDSLLFEPGTKFNYTTFGFTLLQAVIEKVSGKTYEEFMKEYIWLPCGMNNTSLDVYNRSNNQKAQGYGRDLVKGNIFPSKFDDVSFKYAAGGVLSNAEDLVKMCIALEQGKLLNEKSINEMFTPGSRNNGLGWGVRTKKNNNAETLLASHPGRSNGFESYLFYYPEKKVSIAVVMNQNFISDIKLLMRFTEGLASYFLPVNESVKKKLQYIPYLPLLEQMREPLLKGKIQEAIQVYRQFRTNPLSKEDNTEETMNTIGYQLINFKQYAMALEIFRTNTEDNPRSSNAFDSLGEIYMLMGNKQESIRWYTKAIELDHKNENAKEKLKQLTEAN